MKIGDSTFRQELETLIDKYDLGTTSDTPSFVLADYLINCLHAHNSAVIETIRWFSEEVKD